MKKITYIITFFILVSCNYFEKKKITISDDLIEQKLKKINLSQIDKYPIFEGCEDINNDVIAEKECFVNTLSNHITDYLSAQNIVLENPIIDTIQVRLQVNQKGTVLIQNYTVSDTVVTVIPNIKSLISESIAQLEPIKPAYKKLPKTGELIPVTTQFIIPIVISE